jgi:hypothetical protein
MQFQRNYRIAQAVVHTTRVFRLNEFWLSYGYHEATSLIALLYSKAITWQKSFNRNTCVICASADQSCKVSLKLQKCVLPR